MKCTPQASKAGQVLLPGRHTVVHVGAASRLSQGLALPVRHEASRSVVGVLSATIG